MMKLLSFFGKKVKSRASERYSNPFAEFLSDANRDGHISAAELQNVMKRLGMKKVSLAESSAMLKIAGSNFGGLINFEHFAKLMTSSIFTKHGVL
ncbi:hypothetical protein Mapa_001293 [Marchantia paleacea]|nr:hypothetical protein Mapa_001293 [Marchantia paleacea]